MDEVFVQYKITPKPEGSTPYYSTDMDYISMLIETLMDNGIEFSVEYVTR
jgi:hypothetical protein